MKSQSKKNKILQLINSYGSICCWCNKPINDDEITLEHLLPKSLGGSNAIGNLLLACFACNNSRGNRLLPEKCSLDSIGYKKIITWLQISQPLLVGCVLKTHPTNQHQLKSNV